MNKKTRKLLLAKVNAKKEFNEDKKLIEEAKELGIDLNEFPEIELENYGFEKEKPPVDEQTLDEFKEFKEGEDEKSTEKKEDVILKH